MVFSPFNEMCLPPCLEFFSMLNNYCTSKNSNQDFLEPLIIEDHIVAL